MTAFGNCGLGVEAADGFNYGGDFVVAGGRVDGEREDFLGGLFARGEVAGFVAEMLEGGLLVKAERVVDFAADLVRGEVRAEVIATGGADDVLVEDVLGARVRVRECDGGCEAVGGE